MIPRNRLVADGDLALVAPAEFPHATGIERNLSIPARVFQYQVRRRWGGLQMSSVDGLTLPRQRATVKYPMKVREVILKR